MNEVGKARRELTADIAVSGLDCAACAERVESALRSAPGVVGSSASLAAGRVRVRYMEGETGPEELADAVARLGFGTEVLLAGGTSRPTEEKRREERLRGYGSVLARILLVAVTALLSYLGIGRGVLPFDIALVGIIPGALPVLQEGWSSLRAKDITVETFMSIAIIATVAVGEFRAASVIIVFLAIGEIIESSTVERARLAIRDLVQFAPPMATLLTGAGEKRIEAGELKPGDRILVRPGERIAADGEILSGSTAVDQSAITGESMPVEKGVGELVFAGTVNAAGAIIVRATRVGPDTTLAKIIELVEEAEASKAPVQRIADRFAAWFTPIVLSIAALTLVLTRDVRSAIAVIVVACPCSVAIATPLAVISSIGRAAKRGIIVKGGRHLETLARLQAVLVDKTGTLTVGEPVVTGIIGFHGHTDDEIIGYAAVVEKMSEHALSRAVLAEAHRRGIVPADPESFCVLPGLGVKALSGGECILLGSPALLAEEGVEMNGVAIAFIDEAEEQGTGAILVAHDGELCGAMTVRDTIRPETRDALRALREELGIGYIEMLTGDVPAVAAAVAGDAGISRFKAGLMPDEKLNRVKELQGEGLVVAMVGDGINDAPALAQADLGVAMGAAGTDAALEAADVALMRDDWGAFTEAVRIGRRTFRTIKQNLWLSVIFNVVGVSLAAFGFLSPAVAAFTHILPDVAVFLNSAKLMAKKSAA